MKQKYSERINEYDLPFVPIMVHLQEIEDWMFHKAMIEELEERGDQPSQWALQMVEKLQSMWFESVGKLQEIEQIISREPQP